MGVWLWWQAAASETLHSVTLAEGGVQQVHSAWGLAPGSQGPMWFMPGDRQRRCRRRATLWSSGRGLVLPSLFPPCPAARVFSWGGCHTWGDPTGLTPPSVLDQLSKEDLGGEPPQVGVLVRNRALPSSRCAK